MGDAYSYAMYADSGCPSVTAAGFIAKKTKTLFVGKVKTCKLGFPTKAFERLAGDATVKGSRKTVVQKKARETIATYTTATDNVEIMAVGVRAVD